MINGYVIVQVKKCGHVLKSVTRNYDVMAASSYVKAVSDGVIECLKDKKFAGCYESIGKIYSMEGVEIGNVDISYDIR